MKRVYLEYKPKKYRHVRILNLSQGYEGTALVSRRLWVQIPLNYAHEVFIKRSEKAQNMLGAD